MSYCVTTVSCDRCLLERSINGEMPDNSPGEEELKELGGGDDTGTGG